MLNLKFGVICLSYCIECLCSLHVVFGKLVSGFATLDEIAADEYGSPFTVSKCGKYEGPVIPEGMCALNACILCSSMRKFSMLL